MKGDMKKNILSCITILIRKVTCTKLFEVFYGKPSAKPGVSRGPWLHNAAIFKDNPGKKLTQYGKSDTFREKIKAMNCMLKS